jgi:MinD-like ATPase involved in chromosome partitioning or flagellar assembly
LVQPQTPFMPPLPPGAPIVVITGARPGTGATTVAVNLAAVLADRDQRVLVVDANRERGNLAEVAGLGPFVVEHALPDVFAGRCTVADAIVPGPARSMLLASIGCSSLKPDRDAQILSPAASPAQCSKRDQQRLLTVLQSLRADFDLLLIDIGSGLNAWTRRFWLHSQLVLLVTTPDGSTLLPSYAAIKRSVVEGVGPNLRLIINQSESDRAAAEAHRRMANACSRFLRRTLPAMPSLPRYADESPQPRPRAWERPNTPFGHAMLWLGRAVGDVLSENLPDFQSTAAARARNVEPIDSTARC